jgi:hypothetical protein
MAHKIIRIRSEERLNPTTTTSSNFTVAFSNVASLAGINRIVVESVDVPFVQYNIKTGPSAHTTTNTFTFFDGAVNQTITLPVGNYDIAALIAALVADPIAVGVGLGITLDPLTGHLTFTTTAPVTFLSAASGDNMAPLLGITADSGAAVMSFTAQGIVDLSVHPNIYVASQTLSDGSAMISPTLGPVPVIAVVPITAFNWGEVIKYRAYHPELEDTIYPSLGAGKNFSTIDLQLYDGDAQLIDLQGLEWTIVLKGFITTL